jgi:hypothetical protein
MLADVTPRSHVMTRYKIYYHARSVPTSKRTLHVRNLVSSKFRAKSGPCACACHCKIRAITRVTTCARIVPTLGSHLFLHYSSLMSPLFAGALLASLVAPDIASTPERWRLFEPRCRYAPGSCGPARVAASLARQGYAPERTKGTASMLCRRSFAALCRNSGSIRCALGAEIMWEQVPPVLATLGAPPRGARPSLSPFFEPKRISAMNVGVQRNKGFLNYFRYYFELSRIPGV